jgi:hypothetical protein
MGNLKFIYSPLVITEFKELQKMKKIMIILLLVPVFSLYSQSEWQDYVSWAWGGKFEPFMEADAGFGTPSHKKFNGTFADIGSLELKLGFTELKKYKDYIQALDERYLFGTYISTDLAKSLSTESGGVKSEMLRFGIGNRLGYGYEIGNSSLIAYNQMQLVLTKTEFSDTAALSPEDMNILNRLQGDYRMGTTFEGGVKFYIAQSFSVNAGVEGAVVFPRYLFMKWMGSFVLQSVSLGLVSYFSEAIINSSPFLGPIMYFALKNGISAAWYFAMKDQMYWPVKSESPFAFGTIRIGTSLTF